jgi:hypothetical protein
VGSWVLASVPDPDGGPDRELACWVAGVEHTVLLDGCCLAVTAVRLRLPDGSRTWLPARRVVRLLPGPSRGAVPKQRRRGTVLAEDAVREAVTLGYDPLGPYPGRAMLPWDMRCVKCGRVRRTSLTRLRRERPCQHHREIKIPAPR